MAPTITFNGGPFNGHVGITAFREGQAESDNPGALAFFRDHPDYTVHEDPAPDLDPNESVADYIVRQEQGNAAAEQARAEQLAEAAAALAAEVEAAAAAEAEAEADESPDPDDSDDRPEDGPEDETSPEADTPTADPYDLSVAALRKLCAVRSIPQAGSKADLQDRLRAADNQE